MWRQVEKLPALGQAFAFESGEVLLGVAGAPFAGLLFERSTTPADEGETEMQRSPVDQADPTHGMRLAELEGLGFVG